MANTCLFRQVRWFCRWGLALASCGLLAFACPAADWPMWGRTPDRNNVGSGKGIPDHWACGKYDPKTRRWSGAQNIKWVAELGSQTYGAPISAAGKIFVGTNNSRGYLKRAPPEVDLGVLLCFRESDGAFLWQYSAEKLPTGRVNDWPLQGICSAPIVEGDRLWFVDNRGCVVCLDAEGFTDGEDDGPVVGEWGGLFHAVDGLGTRSHYYRRDLEGALRAMLQAHQIDPGDNRILPDGPRRWKVAHPKTPDQPGWILRQEQDAIACFRVTAGREARQESFRVRCETQTLLDQGRLPGPLRSLFDAAGAPLADEVTIESTKLLEWTLRWRNAGERQEARIKLKNWWLAAERKLTPADRNEADVVWRLDMMKVLGVHQHNMANCAPVIWGNVLFVCTSHGVDESHVNLPNPQAPSFLALDKRTGEVLWQDNSPGENILHGQWSAPCVGKLGGVPQVIFAGGDGWLYSFHAEQWDHAQKRPQLLWKFDCNLKTSKYAIGGRGDRNSVIAFPAIYEGRVYVAVGEDPEHGEGPGRLWCLDPTRRGDVSAEVAVKVVAGKRTILPPRRIQAVVKEQGEAVEANPNSAVLWRYDAHDYNGDGKIEFDETFHRSLSSAACKDGLLFIVDFSGLVHCLDARTGQRHWVYDTLAACWTTPLIVDDKVYVGDEDGDVCVLALSADPSKSLKTLQITRNGKMETETVAHREVNMVNSIYTSPMVANNVLYISNKTHLFAITAE